LKLINTDLNNEKIQEILQLLNDTDLVLISVALANQIRRYEHLSWHKEKELQAVYERMRTIYTTLKNYEESQSNND